MNLSVVLSVVLLTQVGSRGLSDNALLQSLITSRNQELVVLHEGLSVDHAGKKTSLRARIKKLEAWEWEEICRSMPGIRIFSMKHGDIGFVDPRSEFVVRDVLGDNNYLVVMYFQGIGSPTQMLWARPGYSSPFRIKMMGSYAVGSKVSISGLYFVDCNGSTFSLKSIDPLYLESLLKRYKNSNEFRQNQYKIWTDSRGRAVVARFRGVVGDKVQLEDEQGAGVVIPLKRLSTEDQKTAKKLSREK
jgi:hypothetical protein